MENGTIVPFLPVQVAVAEWFDFHIFPFLSQNLADFIGPARGQTAAHHALAPHEGMVGQPLPSPCRVNCDSDIKERGDDFSPLGAFAPILIINTVYVFGMQEENFVVPRPDQER